MNILITGASRGIGKAIAEAAANAGHTVALVARSQEALLEVEKGITSKGGKARSFVCDITSSELVSQLHKEVNEAIGTIDIIVNNAGVAPSLKLENTTDDIWQETFATNVDSAFYIVRSFLSDLRSSKQAHIINIASSAALEGFAYTAAYTASKHALLGLSRALAKELFKNSICVATICPGFVRTAIFEESIRNITSKTGKTNQEAELILGGMNISGKVIEPNEIATAVLNAMALAPNENGYEITL